MDRIKTARKNSNEMDKSSPMGRITVSWPQLVSTVTRTANRSKFHRHKSNSRNKTRKFFSKDETMPKSAGNCS